MPMTGEGGNGAMGQAVDVALWTLSGSLLVASVALSLVPDPEVLYELDLSDIALHVLGYSALTGSCLLAAVWRPGRRRGGFPGAGVAIVVGALALGLALELAQGFVPSRSADWRDALANALGITLAWIGWRLIRGLSVGSAQMGRGKE